MARQTAPNDNLYVMAPELLRSLREMVGTFRENRHQHPDDEPSMVRTALYLIARAQGVSVEDAAAHVTADFG